MAVLLVSALVGVGVVLRYGDVNLSQDLIEVGRQNQPLRSDSRFMGRYANPVYHFIFAGLLIFGFLGRKDPKKKKYLRVALLYIAVQVIASGIITQGIKMAVGSPRPRQARQEGYQRIPFSKSTRYRSFPSGHSSDAFSSAGVVWMSAKSPLLVAFSFGYSGMIALSRVFADRHYLLDITGGMVIGFGTALIVMYKKYRE